MDINEIITTYNKDMRSTVYAYMSESYPGHATLRMVIDKTSYSVDFRFEGEDAPEEINDTITKIAQSLRFGAENLLSEVNERKVMELDRLKKEVKILEEVNEKLRSDNVSTITGLVVDDIPDPVADGVEDPNKD